MGCGCASQATTGSELSCFRNSKLYYIPIEDKKETNVFAFDVLTHEKTSYDFTFEEEIYG